MVYFGLETWVFKRDLSDPLEHLNQKGVGGMSDNFKVFKEAKLADKTAEQAAFETWTGRQAEKQGFTKVKVVTDDDNLVIVEFTKEW